MTWVEWFHLAWDVGVGVLVGWALPAAISARKAARIYRDLWLSTNTQMIELVDHYEQTRRDPPPPN